MCHEPEERSSQYVWRRSDGCVARRRICSGIFAQECGWIASCARRSPEERASPGGVLQSELPHVPVHLSISRATVRDLQRFEIYSLGNFAERCSGYARVLQGIRHQVSHARGRARLPGIECLRHHKCSDTFSDFTGRKNPANQRGIRES